MTPLEVVAAQFEAYNRRDADALSLWYAEDCVVGDLYGEPSMLGREAVRARFAKTFAENPQNRAWSKYRFAIGRLVIDHEEGERAPGVGHFEIVAVYTIRDGLIARLDMAR